jgi:hypothetical protein
VRSLAAYAVATVVLYAVGWTASYVFVEFPNGPPYNDFDMFFPYLYLAWTGPGERPMFIQLGALLITGVGLFAFARRRRRLANEP